jgi:hypothetical protein
MQTPWAYLSGVRITHTLYYFELLIYPSVLILLFSGFKRIPVIIVFLGFWVLLMGFVGFFKGNFPSFIYDRTRNWAVLLVPALFYRYNIDRNQLLRMLKPMFFCAWIGNIVVIYIINGSGLEETPKNIVSINFFGALFYLLMFATMPKPWYLAGLVVAFAYPLFGAIRGAMIAMAASIAVMVALYSKKLKPSVILAVFGIMLAAFLVCKFVPLHYERASKDIRAGGLELYGLKQTWGIRLAEIDLLKENMHSITDWVIGRGAGEEWSAVGLYESVTGTERYTFHIYYAQILFNYGLVGLASLLVFLGIPLIRGLLTFSKHGLLGQTCILFLIALLIYWGNSAADTWIEVFAYCLAVYGINIDQKDNEKITEYDTSISYQTTETY